MLHKVLRNLEAASPESLQTLSIMLNKFFKFENSPAEDNLQCPLHMQVDSATFEVDGNLQCYLLLIYNILTKKSNFVSKNFSIICQVMLDPTCLFTLLS